MHPVSRKTTWRRKCGEVLSTFGDKGQKLLATVEIMDISFLIMALRLLTFASHLCRDISYYELSTTAKSSSNSTQSISPHLGLFRATVSNLVIYTDRVTYPIVRLIERCTYKTCRYRCIGEHLPWHPLPRLLHTMRLEMST